MPHIPDTYQTLTTLLQRSPHARSALYLSLMAGIITVSNEVMTRLDPSPYVNIHPPAFPFVALGTYHFARLRPADTHAWQQLPTKQDLWHLTKGLSLGSMALLTIYGIAAAKGWISPIPSEATPNQAMQSLAFLTVLELMAVWNEEQVFRGYGLDTLKQSVGTPAAAIILAALFALYHDLDPIRLINMALFALATTLQRQESGGLWMPIGFHLAWNLWQVGILGPHDGPTSLVPITTHGPELWIGEPGTPERGWLVTIVLAVITLALWAWRKQRLTR